MSSSLPALPGDTRGVPRVVLPPISRWKVITGAVVVAVLTATFVTVLWWAATRGLVGRDLVSARLDALRVGLSIAVGGGGLYALYLAWRRQRSTEADLDNRERVLAHQLQVAADTKAHQERVAASAENDAEARRITDLYTKAVEQLGSDKAPVRLGGLYALERLAQDNPSQRQTIVNVWCAYLRMPYTIPADEPPDTEANEETQRAHREAVQEKEVRLTAQRLLSEHVYQELEKTVPSWTFWEDIDLNLTGATLINFDLSFCHLRYAAFASTNFIGSAYFNSTTFSNTVTFDMTTFNSPTNFGSATFEGSVRFRRAIFVDYANFESAQFKNISTFDGISFRDYADFDHAVFDAETSFANTVLVNNCSFQGAAFTDHIPREVLRIYSATSPSTG